MKRKIPHDRPKFRYQTNENTVKSTYIVYVTLSYFQLNLDPGIVSVKSWETLHLIKFS